MNLNEFDIVIINSSAGKDSLCSIFEICRLAQEQNYPFSRIIVSHQDLGMADWPGTVELAKVQADHFGLKIIYARRRTKEGREEELLDYVLRRGKWPSNKQRYCTSDFKRAPGARVVVQVAREYSASRILHVFGFRKEESPSRAKKQAYVLNDRLSTKSREVFDFLPIHDWPVDRVWKIIRGNNLPYHPAYDLGMPRLSCCFCIFSPFDALVLAGYHNSKLLDDYITTENVIDHSFRDGFKIESIRDEMMKGNRPMKVSDWKM